MYITILIYIIHALIELNYAELSTYFNQVEKIYFLIASGSIICSVFYIAVLLKRYPIINCNRL